MKGRIFLLMQLLHLAVSFKTDCPRPCIPLETCSELAALIRTADVKVVQEATCAFQGVMPLVCCPESSTPTPSPTPTPTPNPTPKPFVSGLLPKDCGQFANLQGNRVHGGNKTRLGEYPWMAALGYNNALTNKVDFLCGGSVINERYVLTAAHCVSPKQPDIIRLGEWDLSTDEDCEITDSGFEFCAPEPAQDFLYEEILSHPDYNSRAQVSDDIALIRLTTPINFRRNRWIQPVCMPEQDFNVRSAADQRNAVVSGWGFTENGTVSDVLLQVYLPMVDNDVCNTTYKGRVLDEQVCFGGVKGKDSCGGDSGGPLVISASQAPPFTQIGIVSYGPRDCGREGVPGVYTSVAKYRNWIEQTLRE
ncbi:phenoloxidase-activating factor 1-like [Portunus trituberculatus]|uniref:phenoloxidase-activating factor 1-like n=1 Tax=Portunus trituberculatus TaxID=210409 RepID=UPI001E1CCB18|nr:phenoloxidase-activating factor 1-like [Portunus trituberculatus]